MRASQCLVFLFLLIAVRAFPQNVIETVTESPVVVGETAVNAVEPVVNSVDVVANSVDPVVNVSSSGDVKNETPVVQSPEVISNENVVASEVSIPQEAGVSVNEVQATNAISQEVVSTQAPLVEVPKNVVNEVVVTPSGGVQNEVNAPAVVVDQVPVESVAETIALTTAASPNQTASPQPLPEVVTSAPEVIAPSANDSVPVASTRNLDSSVVASTVTTAVPETTTVPSATEAQVPIVSGGETIVSRGSQIPLSEFEAPESANEVLGRAVLTEFPDIEVIIPLVDVSVPVISGRSLSIEPVVSSAVESVPATSGVPVPQAPLDTVPVVEAVIVPIFGSDAVVPDSSTVSPVVEVTPVPEVASRSLDAESTAPVKVSEAAVPVNASESTAVFPDSSTGSANVEVVSVPEVASRSLGADASVNAPESPITAGVPESVANTPSIVEPVSSTTDVPALESSTSGVPEVVTVAPANDSSAIVSSSGLPSVDDAVEVQIAVDSGVAGAVEVPQVDSGVSSVAEASQVAVPQVTVESEISLRDLSVEPTSSSVGEASVAKVSVPVSSVGPEEVVDPVSSTTASSVSPSSEVPEVVDVNATEELPRSLDPAVVVTRPVSSITVAAEPVSSTTVASEPVSSTTIASVPVSSTTSAPEVSSSVIPSESAVSSSTNASVAADSTPSPTPGLDTITDSPVSSQTPSIPCTKAGNFSVPNNCRAYRTCSTDGVDLILQQLECPAGYAFSPILRRCSRDISPCGDSEPTCVRAGSVADPNTSTAYYWCTPSLLGGYHKYHVQCEANEVYVSSINLCLPEALRYGHKGAPKAHSDRDVVKAEWKLLKKELKHQAKEDKVRQKLEAKAKAHAEKLATKILKKQKGDTKRHDDSDDDDDDEDED